jgi:MFS family permease
LSLRQAILLAVLNHTSFKGSKVLIALYAIHLGASPSAIGILISMYSLAPIVIAIHAGRMSDRLGHRLPMLFGSAGLGTGLLIPWAWPSLPALYASAALIGSCYIFFVVSLQSLVGSVGSSDDRARNYSTYSLGIAVTSFLGPLAAGFLIDGVGHALAYFALALVPIGPIVLLLSWRLPRVVTPSVAAQRAPKPVAGFALLRENPRLVRVLILSSVIETGLELYTFYMPLHGHGIGLSASVIGSIMSAYAVALFLVRFAMPLLVRRAGENRVLVVSLLTAAATYALFPFLSNPLLLGALSFVLGLGLGCCSPLSMMLTYNRSPEGRSGEGLGLRQTANKATEAAAPLLFGFVGSAVGMVPVFWATALLIVWGTTVLRAR